MADHPYVVMWPQMSVHVDGKDQILSRGDRLPDGVPNQQATLLESIGALAITGPVPPAPAATTPPAQSAVRGEWEAYAIQRGMTLVEVKAHRTKGALIAAVTGVEQDPATEVDGQDQDVDDTNIDDD